MRCEVMPGGRRGEVAFVGEVRSEMAFQFVPGYSRIPQQVEGLSGGGHWVGVKFDEPLGKSDGTVKGTRFFECEPMFGGFIRGRNVTVGDFPEVFDEDLEDEDEEDEL